MSDAVGMMELACIQAVSHMEGVAGHPLSEQERALFKLGFISGTQHGLDVAKQFLRDEAVGKI